MDPTLDYRHHLARRFVLIALAAVPSAMVVGPGCGSSTVRPPDGSGTQCFLWPQEWPPGAQGGSGGSAGQPGSGGAGGEGGAPIPACPSSKDAYMYLPNNSGCAVQLVVTEGTYVPPSPPDFDVGQQLPNGSCCYQVEYWECVGDAGRPFLVDGQLRTAAQERGDFGWGSPDAPRPAGAELSAAQRARLAEAWARDALLEHASVASFGRFALELLAVKAPPELVEMAHHAALDEIRHARLCFTLASVYAGQPIAPGAFPFEGQVEVSSHLPAIAARVVVEGCVGETLASVLAAEALAHATDAAVRKVLSAIAEDEARHAELAWRTVAWAVSHGDADVKEAVAQAFAQALTRQPATQGGAQDDSLIPHGRLSMRAIAVVTQRVLADVVQPAAAALLRGRRAADPVAQIELA